MSEIEQLWLICGEYYRGENRIEKYVTYFFGTKKNALMQLEIGMNTGNGFICPINHSIEVRMKKEQTGNPG